MNWFRWTIPKQWMRPCDVRRCGCYPSRRAVSDSASVGPNAQLINGNVEDYIKRLKAEREGEIEVAGPDLAHSLTTLGLIDEYRIYLHPVVLGQGSPFFAGPRPPLRLMTSDRIGEDILRLTYVPTAAC